MTDRSTRYVDQPEEPRMDRDIRTRVSPLDSLPLPFTVAYEALFFANYRSIRTLARTVTPGVGLVVVEVRSGALAGRAWVARKPDRPNALILGRHSQCDLVLEQPSVSLRHVAVLVPSTGGDPRRFSPHFSVHELNTELGLHGSNGLPMPGARVERFGMFRLGGYVLFMFATGESDAWPELGNEAWEKLHARVKEEGPEDQWPDEVKTVVASIRGPVHFSEPLVKEDEMVTQVSVIAREESEQVRLGSEALRRGVIFGRYPRCDTVLKHHSISRVHLLVIEVDGEVVAVDTGSMNGVSTGDEENVRVVMLGRGERAVLGEDVATLRLESAS